MTRARSGRRSCRRTDSTYFSIPRNPPDPQRLTASCGEPDLTTADLSTSAPRLSGVEATAGDRVEASAAFVEEQEQAVWRYPSKRLEALDAVSTNTSRSAARAMYPASSRDLPAPARRSRSRRRVGRQQPRWVRRGSGLDHGHPEHIGRTEPEHVAPCHSAPPARRHRPATARTPGHVVRSARTRATSGTRRA